MEVSLEGILEKITYYNQENLYMVGRLRSGDGQIVNIVGSFPPLAEGETLRVEGSWQIHDRYGKQVAVKNWERIVPPTREGLLKYLSSGLLKGIGPVMAERLIDHFGTEVLEIIEKEPSRLQEVEGVGPKKIESISESYAGHKEIKNLMIFLQNYGISPSLAFRLYKHYGNNALSRLKEDPYHLAEEVYGIGFKTADKIALQLGLPLNDPQRIRAALHYLLGSAAEEGHVYLPESLLCKRSVELLETGNEAGPLELQIAEQLTLLRKERRIFKDRVEGEDVWYHAPFFYAETGVARLINRLLLSFTKWGSESTEQRSVEEVIKEESDLSSEQAEALRMSLGSGVSIITGGPGTGKTTTIRALISLFKKLRKQVLLAAPTGRAAKRVTEATGEGARTIHRWLEYNYTKEEGFSFLRGEERPLEADVIIIDESSMIDLLLMYNLIKAIPPGCRLILVGDTDQLPAVGAGNVLKDLIQCGRIPCIRLGTVFRQARESMIVVNAHRVNRGQFPLFNVRGKDFYFVEEEDPEKISSRIVGLCRERIPAFGPFDPVEDIQVLSPMRRTPVGVDRLNRLLQEALNPPLRNGVEIKSGGATFRPGDKVMQIRNNYKKEVFNGDIGRIAAIDKEEGELIVSYPDLVLPRTVVYEFGELDELALAYAVSIHKSQGSEYPVVIFPVVTQHFMLLQRNLLYTGITRAKKLAVLLGTRKALGIALRNNSMDKRYSYLDRRICLV